MKIIISMAIIFMIVTGAIGLGILNYYYEPTMKTCEKIVQTNYTIATNDLTECNKLLMFPETFYWMEGYILIVILAILIGICGSVIGLMIEDNY